MSKASECIGEAIRQFEEAVQHARARGVPENELEQDEKSIQFLRQLTEDLEKPAPVPVDPTREELEMTAFVERLAARQGTFIPDFRALFQKKAEIDRKLLGPNDP